MFIILFYQYAFIKVWWKWWFNT